MLHLGLPKWLSGRESFCQCRRCRRHGFDSLGRGNPLEEEMATQSSILAWKIPQTEESGGLPPLGHKESDTTEQLNTHARTSQGFRDMP